MHFFFAPNSEGSIERPIDAKIDSGDILHYLSIDLLPINGRYGLVMKRGKKNAIINPRESEPVDLLEQILVD